MGTRSRGPFYVYILANVNRTIYIGVTSDIADWAAQHKDGTGSSFTSKFGVNQLVHVEEFSSIVDAITREKELKGWRRARKIALTEAANPNWQDLGAP